MTIHVYFEPTKARYIHLFYIPYGMKKLSWNNRIIICMSEWFSWLEHWDHNSPPCTPSWWQFISPSQGPHKKRNKWHNLVGNQPCWVCWSGQLNNCNKKKRSAWEGEATWGNGRISEGICEGQCNKVVVDVKVRTQNACYGTSRKKKVKPFSEGGGKEGLSGHLQVGVSLKNIA